MKKETDPVTDDEWLLRRVFVDKFNTSRVPLISPKAFEPRVNGRDPDITGISLYRLSCLSTPHQVLQGIPSEKRHNSGVVKLQVIAVSSLDTLRLTIRNDSRPPIPGHVVIPELNSSSYSKARPSFTPTLLALAKLASENENIVILPTALQANDEK